MAAVITCAGLRTRAGQGCSKTFLHSPLPSDNGGVGAVFSGLFVAVGLRPSLGPRLLAWSCGPFWALYAPDAGVGPVFWGSPLPSASASLGRGYWRGPADLFGLSPLPGAGFRPDVFRALRSRRPQLRSSRDPLSARECQRRRTPMTSHTTSGGGSKNTEVPLLREVRNLAPHHPRTVAAIGT